MITALWLLVIAPAMAKKLPVLAPAGIEIVAGILRVDELLERAMVLPAEPAACERLTVQVDVIPEVRVFGAQVSAVIFGFPAPEAFAENSTGGNPFTSAKTSMAPVAPEAAVNVTEACPLLLVTAVSGDTAALPCVTPKCATAFGRGTPELSLTTTTSGWGAEVPAAKDCGVPDTTSSSAGRACACASRFSSTPPAPVIVM